MRTSLRYLTPLVAAAGAAVTVLAAPTAGADPDSNLPSCTDVAGDAVLGDTTTECATPGNVQLNASPTVTEPDYPYPWDDEFYGPALIFGDGGGYHGGGRR